MKKNQEKDQAGASKLKEEQKKEKRIGFMGLQKEEKCKVSSKTQSEDSNISSPENMPMQKSKLSKPSRDECDSSSDKNSISDQRLETGGINKTMDPDQHDSIPTSSEEEVSSSKRDSTSSSMESESNEESTQYVKLQESISTENIQGEKNDVKKSQNGSSAHEKKDETNHEVASGTNVFSQKQVCSKELKVEERQEFPPNTTIYPKSKSREKRQRIFEKVPGQNAVYIPLHGSSDEGENDDVFQENSDLFKSPADDIKMDEHSDQYRQRDVYVEAASEYSIFVPLHGNSGESQKMDDDSKTISDNLTKEEELPEQMNKEAVTTDRKRSMKKEKESAFKTLDENTIIIPLHDSSDEENKKVDKCNPDILYSPKSSPINLPEERKGNLANKKILLSHSKEFEENENRLSLSTSHSNNEHNPVHEACTEPAKGHCFAKPNEMEKREDTLISNTINSDTPERPNINFPSTSVVRKPRLFIKVPNEDAVIIPLHGSSDENELLGNIDEDDGLLETNIYRRKSEQEHETPKMTNKRVVIYEGAPNEYGKIVPLTEKTNEEVPTGLESTDSLVPTVDQQIIKHCTKEKEIIEKTDADLSLVKNEMSPKERIFIKVPNENAVFIPLHGSSDEEESIEYPNIETARQRSESINDTLKIQTIQRIYSDSPNEYKIYIPLRSSSNEETSEGRDVSEQLSNGTTQAISSEVEIPKSSAAIKSVKSKINLPDSITGISNQDAIIIPLHGPSDEENVIRECDDDGLALSVPSTPIMAKGPEKPDVSIFKEEKKFDELQAKYDVITPRNDNLEELSDSGAHEIISNVIPLVSSVTAQDTKPVTEEKKTFSSSEKTTIKNKRMKHRVFVKVPNQDAVIIPLHGSSDEEDTSQTSDEVSLNMPFQFSGASIIETSNKYDILVPLYGIPGETLENSNHCEGENNFAEIVDVPGKEAEEKQMEVRSFNLKEENDAHLKTRKPLKLTKIPNEDAYFVPLNGSSDEEDNLIMLKDITEQSAIISLRINPEIKDKYKQTDTPSSVKKQEINKDTEMLASLIGNWENTILQPSNDINKTPLAEESKQRFDEAEEIKLDQQFFKQISSEGIYIPLHGSVEEDLNKKEKGLTNTNKHKESEPHLPDSINSNKYYFNNEENVEKCKSEVHNDSADLTEQSKTLGGNYESQELENKKIEAKNEEVFVDGIQTSEKSKSGKNEHNVAKILHSEYEHKIDPKEQKRPKTKEKVASSKLNQLKIADVVLQVLSKKSDSILESKTIFQKGSSTKGVTIKPLEQDVKECEHEYEPIQAPRAASQPPDNRSNAYEARTHPVEVRHIISEARDQPVTSKSLDDEEHEKQEEEDRYEVVRPQEIPSLQEETPGLQVDGGYEIVEEPQKKEHKHFIRIPNEDAIIIPLHGSSDEELNPDRYKNLSLMMSEEEIERHSTSAPIHKPQREINSEEIKPHESTIQERFRTQADRFTTKLKGISKPNIHLPKPKMKLPERPKIPDIPKIKLPERPKFSMPDTSKFHLPERPKFNFPDRSKFHFPEKPKFLTERPKFKLPQRPKFSRTEKKPKGPKLKKPNPSSLRRPLRDVVTISSQSTPGSTQNIFETLKFRTYPRFFKKKKAPVLQKMSSLDTESSQPSTPPTRLRSYSEHQQNVSWVHSYRDVKFADEDTNLRVERMEEEYEKEEATPFHDNYDTGVRNINNAVIEHTHAPSMTSVVSEKGSSGSSSVRRRAGVIEEIDSDEFFVREKGLSREDVDVSRYLSLEIRDAFRQTKNALASLDSELYDDEEPEIKFEHTPRAPQRTKPRKSSSFEQEQEFHTFPKRPSRRKESDPEIVVVKPPRRFRSGSKSGSKYRKRQSSMPSLNTDLETTPPEAHRRKSKEASIKSLNKEGHVPYIDEDSVKNQMSTHHSSEIPPVAPLRKSRSRGTSLADDDRTSRGADSAILLDDDDEAHQMEDDGILNHTEDHRRQVEEEIIIEDKNQENYVLDEDEDGGYKEIESVTVQESLEVKDEKSVDYSGYAVVAKNRKKSAPPRPPPPPPHQHFHFQSQLDSIKNTGKTIFFTYPRRAIKSLNKQPPTRPVRNYSTLGPVRPPRRNRVFRQPLYMTGEIPCQQEFIIDKDRDLQSGDIVKRMKGRPLPPPPRPPRKLKDSDSISEAHKIVKSIPTEHIIATAEIDADVEEELEPEAKESRFSYLKSKRDQFFNTISKYSPLSKDDKEEKVKEELIQTGSEQQTISQQTSFDYGEVSVSIQTDPLPKGVVVIDQEIEETEEIIILPNNNKESLDFNKETLASEIPLRSSSLPIEGKTHKNDHDRDSPEANIFQHALERVEAARGVLKEAREKVTPESTTSLDKKTTEEKEIHPLRMSYSEASKGILKDEEEREIRGSTCSLDWKTRETRENQPLGVSQSETLPTSIRSYEVEKEETPPPLPTRPHYTKPIPVSFPDKLHLSELEVDKLNVSEIQANKIKVSEIEGTCVEVTELTSRGGNLTINGIELPPDFISNIVAQVAAQQTQKQPSPTQLQRLSRETTPQRQIRRVLTPPPSILVHSSLEHVSIPEPKAPETDITEHIPQPKATKSKGRKLPTRVIDDSEDELASSLIQRGERERESMKQSEKGKNDPSSSVPSQPSDLSLKHASSSQLMRMLLSIWQENAIQGAGAFVQGVNSLFPEGDKRRDAQVAAVILLILITGLIIVGYGFDNSIHHHHWDYLPPR